MTEENHEKTPVRLVGHGIWTRDLPNASLVRYHGATSLGRMISLEVSILIHDIFSFFLSGIYPPLMYDVHL